MQEIRTVCIVGPGAIGSLYAGHLGTIARAKVLTRRPEHAAALNASGLTVSGKSTLTEKVRSPKSGKRAKAQPSPAAS